MIPKSRYNGRERPGRTIMIWEKLALHRNADVGNPTLYCSPARSTTGRCADFYNGSCSCQSSAVHANATSTNGANNVCVPGSCTYQ